MTMVPEPDASVAGLRPDLETSPNSPVASLSPWPGGPGLHSGSGASLDQETQLAPQQSSPGLTQMLVQLRRIRTELTALDHRPSADKVVHDLDEVIQRAGRSAPRPVNDQETPRLPESRGPWSHEPVHLPSGPDYWAPTLR